MYQIGDFSRLGRINVRQLRHYDRLGLLRPEYQDRDHGFRFYSDKQLDDLNRIQALKGMELSIKEISEYLTDTKPSPEELRALLDSRQSALKGKILNLQIERVEARLKALEEAENRGSFEAALKPSPERRILSLRRTVPLASVLNHFRGNMREELFGVCRKAGLKQNFQEITLYHNREYRESDLDVEVGLTLPENVTLSVDSPFRIRTISAQRQVAALDVDSSLDTGLALAGLLSWIGHHNLQTTGALYQFRKPERTAVIELGIPVTNLS